MAAGGGHAHARHVGRDAAVLAEGGEHGGGVEGGGGGGRRGRRPERRAGAGERGAEIRRQVAGGSAAVIVQIVDPRRLTEQVVVDGGDVEARAEQARGDDGQLGLGEHKVAHHVGRVGGAGERGPRGQRERGLHGDVAHFHRQIAARERDAIHVAGGGDRKSTRLNS